MNFFIQFQGKYFGPNSPVEGINQHRQRSPTSPYSEVSDGCGNSEDHSGHQYLADASNSCNYGEGVSYIAGLFVHSFI